MEKVRIVILVIVVVALSPSFNAQNWKDSLRAARNLYQSGDYGSAYQKFIAAQRLAPSEIDLSRDIATAAYRKGEYEKAADAFEKLMAKTESDAQWQKWHNIGNSQWQQKDLAAAAESYKKAIRLNPEAEESRYNLAQVLRQMRLQQEQEQDNNSDENCQNNDSDKAENQNQQNTDDGEDDDHHSQSEKDSAPNQKNEKDKQEETEGISNKRRDRMLEDLLEKEIATQQKMTAKDQEGKEIPIQSGKEW